MSCVKVSVSMVRGAAAGVLLISMLAVVACATTASKPRDAGEAASAPPTGAEAQPQPSAPAAPATPAPAASAPEAAEAPAAPRTETGDPAVAGSEAASSDVAAYMADPQAIQRASQLFRAVCTGYCHSTQPTAERVAPNLFDCAWDHGGSDQEVFHSISAGITDTQMQGFGEKLPREDLWKLVAYLRQRSTCK